MCAPLTSQLFYYRRQALPFRVRESATATATVNHSDRCDTFTAAQKTNQLAGRKRCFACDSPRSGLVMCQSLHGRLAGNIHRLRDTNWTTVRSVDGERPWRTNWSCWYWRRSASLVCNLQVLGVCNWRLILRLTLSVSVDCSYGTMKCICLFIFHIKCYVFVVFYVHYVDI